MSNHYSHTPLNIFSIHPKNFKKVIYILKSTRAVGEKTVTPAKAKDFPSCIKLMSSNSLHN